MIAVPILIRPSDRGAPLRVAIIRTQVRDHDDDALACGAARAAGGAGRVAGRGQLVAFPAAGAAP